MKAVGNCYEAAAKFVWAHLDRALLVCHGEPLGQGPIDGVRHGHAWVEEEIGLGKHKLTVVHDVSNGKTIEGMPVALYYAVGRIDSDTVQRYDLHAANLMMLKTRHYGPWEEDHEPAA